MAALLDEQGLHACAHHGALPSPQMLALLDEQGLLSFTFDEEGLLDAGAEIVREVPDELQALLLIASWLPLFVASRSPLDRLLSAY